MRRKPAATFAIVCLIATAGLATYLFNVGSRTRHDPQVPAPAAQTVHPVGARPAESAVESAPVAAAPESVAPPASTKEAAPGPGLAPAPSKPGAAPASQRLYIRYNGIESHYGSLAWLETTNPDDIHYVDALQCEVVHVSGGHGICMSADRGVFTTYAATLFDAGTFAVRSTFALKGIPSRARVSVDGKLAGLTVFVTGHGYTTLDFSTQTLIVDFASGAVLADLEDFKVSKDGTQLSAPDFNFWGITFTQRAKNFYATLSTAGRHFLIRGDIAARSAEVIHENVECPSLSPDAQRVAYKKRFVQGGRVQWQLHVLELATGRETALSEKRSIDDQLEWLDNRHVLYSVPSADDGSSPSTDVWQAAIDGRTPPKRFLRNAYSPAIARGTSP